MLEVLDFPTTGEDDMQNSGKDAAAIENAIVTNTITQGSYLRRLRARSQHFALKQSHIGNCNGCCTDPIQKGFV